MMSSAFCTTRNKQILIVLLFGLYTLRSLDAQGNRTPEERLAAAVSLASLEAVSRPWHVRIAVSLFGGENQPKGEGAIERWQAGTDSKTVSTFGSSSTTTIVHEGKSYTLVTGEPVSDAARAVLSGILHPGPSAEDLVAVKPDVRRQAFGKQSLDCIMLSRSIPRVAYAPLGLFPTYCLTAADQLAISYDFGSETVVRSAVAHFVDHDVTTADSILEGQQLLAKGKVLTLSTFQPAANEFELTPELLASAGTIRISGGVMEGQILKKVPPTYPEIARRNGTTGTVVLAALVGIDGHVHSLRPMSAPDPDLALSAIAAVRQWLYKPYLLNGEPVAVNTTITVNYNMNPR